MTDKGMMSREGDVSVTNLPSFTRYFPPEAGWRFLRDPCNTKIGLGVWIYVEVR